MRAILLINTGSPKSPTTRDVREYLTDFLTDGRIIGLRQPFRNLLVHGIIAPFRATSSSKKYALIWTDKGSPLQLLTEALAHKVEEISGLPTYVAMRYNRGSVQTAFEAIKAKGIEEVVVVPLFPHYAMSSYESAVAHAVEVHREGGYPFELKCVAPYYNHPTYIEALVAQITTFAQPGEHLVFSYHGIPVAQTAPYQGNPDKDYEQQCIETTRLVTQHPRYKEMGLSHEIAYQSRFGHHKWLSPTLNDRLDNLPTEGKRLVAVVCPSFVCDCLETTWEVGIALKDKFQGDRLTLVECPNDSLLMAQTIVDQVTHLTTKAEIWTKP